MFQDPAFDDFMSRFDDIRPQLKSQQDNRSKSSPLVMGHDSVSQYKKPAIAMGPSGVSEDTKKFAINNDSVSVNGNVQESPEGISGEGVASTGAAVMGALPQAIGLYDSISGKNFDTSGEGNGPGKGGGAIMKGTADGAALGMQVAGPWGAAAGAVVGGVGTAISHNAARNKFFENKKEYNLEENDKSEFKRAKEYAMSRGLGTMEMKKALAQKQLGLMS